MENKESWECLLYSEKQTCFGLKQSRIDFFGFSKYWIFNKKKLRYLAQYLIWSQFIVPFFLNGKGAKRGKRLVEIKHN